MPAGPPHAPAETPALGDRRPARDSRRLLRQGRRLEESVIEVLAVVEARRAEARRAYEALRDHIVSREVATMPIGRLRETTQGRLRLGAIERAGFRTVGSAEAAGSHRLQQIPGVGPQTAHQVVAAARQLEAAMREGVRVRFHADKPSSSETSLLVALRAYESTVRSISLNKHDIHDIGRSLNALLPTAKPVSSRLRWLLTRRARKDAAMDAVSKLHVLLNAPETSTVESKLPEVLERLKQIRVDRTDPWSDYRERAIAYNGLLIDVGEIASDTEAVQGFVPAEIAALVNEQPLDTSLLAVSLRGYQAFGAKFALVQRKAILGDEMGLGKTIEALAVMAHLHGEGERYFLVVCPASVLVNWAHEVERHSKLSAHRIHGMDRSVNLRTWVRRGGVGITTFASLKSLALDDLNVALIVVDEAHYLKNPSAQRTKEVRRRLTDTGRALFLTGTPMENRVEEFRTLVDHLQPDVARGIPTMVGLAGAAAFRKAVAPAYLRRNQVDVLEELPPLIETEDWVQLEGEDRIAYLRAVASGNFMAMRRAAYAPETPAGSSKLTRLVDIAEESLSNGHKVVVFSFFRDVLTRVCSVLGEVTIGPITGDVAPWRRQEMVDDFMERSSPAVMVNQIEAGGVGLNMQAASVVILTEPQWKRTTEDQAVARAHRMGQVRSVEVHRLLGEDSVDQRMLEVLAEKKLLFDEYVRRSAVKDASPDAVDVSDMRATRELVSQAEAERRIIELEQMRLGVESASH